MSLRRYNAAKNAVGKENYGFRTFQDMDLKSSDSKLITAALVDNARTVKQESWSHCGRRIESGTSTWEQTSNVYWLGKVSSYSNVVSRREF